MNQKTFYNLIILLFIGILAMLFIIFNIIKSEGGQCLQDPFLYHTKVLSEANDASLQCSCVALKFGSPSLRWNENGYETNQQLSGNISFPNFSLINEYKSG